MERLPFRTSDIGPGDCLTDALGEPVDPIEGECANCRRDVLESESVFHRGALMHWDCCHFDKCSCDECESADLYDQEFQP